MEERHWNNTSFWSNFLVVVEKYKINKFLKLPKLYQQSKLFEERKSKHEFRKSQFVKRTEYLFRTMQYRIVTLWHWNPFFIWKSVDPHITAEFVHFLKDLSLQNVSNRQNDSSQKFLKRQNFLSKFCQFWGRQNILTG